MKKPINCSKRREDEHLLNKYVHTKKYPICGKTYVPAPYHVYKVGRTPVCSYNCTLPGAKEKRDKEAKV